MNENAAEAVKIPAIGIVVTGVVGALVQLVSLICRVFSIGASAMGGSDEMLMNLAFGAVGFIWSILVLGLSGLVVYGGLQMMKLTNYNLSLAATIVALVPCISPCCCLGLPFGIWGLVVLLDDANKAAFH